MVTKAKRIIAELKQVAKYPLSRDSYRVSMEAADMIQKLLRIVVTTKKDGQIKLGRWKICSDGYYPYCSNCGEEPKNGVMSDFCPNCGAEMVIVRGLYGD